MTINLRILPMRTCGLM